MDLPISFRFNDFRLDIDDFFELSGVRESKKLSHHPFIVFNSHRGDKPQAEICEDMKTLIEKYEDDCAVIAQWQGKWRSDFFLFTIAQVKEYILDHPKQTYHII